MRYGYSQANADGKPESVHMFAKPTVESLISVNIYKNPIAIAALSTAISLGLVAILIRLAPDRDRVEAKSEQKLRVETSTPERAAENFYRAVARGDFYRAFRYGCGQKWTELLSLNVLGSDYASTKAALQKSAHAFSTCPYLVFRESYDFENGSVGLGAIATKNIKNFSKGVEIRILLQKRKARWCVEQISIGAGNCR